MKSYSKIDNNAILSLIGYSPKNFDGDPNPIIVTSYMSNGSLDKILNKCRKSLTPTEFTSTKKYIILIGVALGMKYLHNKGIIHRDLKTGNILLDDDFNPRICDFGCSVYEWNKFNYKTIKNHSK